MTLLYARKAYAERGNLAMACGSAARALVEAGHARLARQGIWITNEKTLLAQAGFGDADAWYEGIGAEPESLIALIERIGSRIRESA